MAGTFVVKVHYRTHTGHDSNTFGTFRSAKAADRFKQIIELWDDARPESECGEILGISARVETVTKPMLAFVQEDVARLSETTPLNETARSLEDPA